MTVWTDHVKEFAKNKGISYGCALSDPECSRTYKPKLLKSPKKEKIPIKSAGLPILRMPENIPVKIDSAPIIKISKNISPKNKIFEPEITRIKDPRTAFQKRFDKGQPKYDRKMKLINAIDENHYLVINLNKDYDNATTQEEKDKILKKINFYKKKKDKAIDLVLSNKFETMSNKSLDLFLAKKP